jgi:hypothetical protein
MLLFRLEILILWMLTHFVTLDVRIIVVLGVVCRNVHHIILIKNYIH